MRSRDLFKLRSQDSLFLFLLGYWILSVSNPFLLTGVTDTAEGSVPFELALRSSLFSVLPACFLVSPLFLLLCFRVSGWFSNPVVLLRFGRKRNVVLRETSALLRLSLAFLLLLYALFAAGCVLRGQLHTAPLAEIAACFLLQLFACLAVGQIHTIAFFLFSSRSLAFFLPYSFFVAQYIMRMTGADGSVPLVNWFSAVQLLPEYYNDLFAAVVTNLCLCFFRYFLWEQTDGSLRKKEEMAA